MKRIFPILLSFLLLLCSGISLAGKKKKGCSRAVAPAYQQMKRNWQKVPAIPEPRWQSGYRDLTFYSVNLGERSRFFPVQADGTLDNAGLEALSRAMADKNTGHTHAAHPRLLKILYKLAVHFKARQINIISGFREPAQAQEKESHHADGSAIDIMIPGVPLPTLAKVARTLGHAGIGFYPTSGFIHIDVRKGPSYFWADPSGPGKPGCLFRIQAPLGVKSDSRWKPEHDEPIPQKTKAGNLLGTSEATLEAEAAAAAKKTTAGKNKAGKKKTGKVTPKKRTKPEKPKESVVVAAPDTDSAPPTTTP